MPAAGPRPVDDTGTSDRDGAAPAIACEDLVVRYGERIAVDHLTFHAEAGEVVALLGRNGAGKTSTVETLEGYRRPPAGNVRVLGLDPERDHDALAPRIGVMLQRGGIYPIMGAERALRLFAAYYREPASPDELLDLVGLRSVAATPYRQLSGGEQQRLALALALVGRPEVVFLDEPTAGIDPEGRVVVRSVVRSLAERGACVLVTTHELAEAELWADRVLVLREGRLVAQGSPDSLVPLAGAAAPARDVLRFGTPAELDVAGLSAAIGVPVRSDGEHRYLVDATPTPALTAAVTSWLAERDLPISDLRTGRSLEEAYLAIVGTEDAVGAKDATGTQRDEDPGDPGPAGRRPTGATPTTVRRPGAATMKAWLAQSRAEVWMTLRRGESLLLTVGIPVVFLLFFSTVHVISTPTAKAVTFILPGVLALAVMSTAMVSLSISTGFERGYGVLKRLGTTPLGRGRLLGAKIAMIVFVLVVQAIVLVPVGVGLGWRLPAGCTTSVGAALGVALLAAIGFGGLGLLMAGVLRAEVNLAAANALYLVLLLLGGMIVPLSKLPHWLADVARVLPAAALADGLHASLGSGVAVPAEAWVVLTVWAVVAPVAAALTFRWE